MQITEYSYSRILMKTLESRDKIPEKLRGVRIKLPINQLLCFLVYHLVPNQYLEIIFLP